MFGKSAKKRCSPQNIISLLITAFLITVLLFAGTSSAVNMTLNLAGDGGDGVFREEDGEDAAVFNLNIDVAENEHVPLSNFTLLITGPYNMTCNFSVNGDNDCDHISISQTLNGTHGYDSGFGYGRGSSDGNAPYGYSNTSFGYGYGWTGAVNEYQYEITWDLSAAGIVTDEDYDGSYTAKILAHADGTSDDFVYVSQEIGFDTEAETSGGGGSGGGGGGYSVPTITEKSIASGNWNRVNNGDETKLTVNKDSVVRSVSFVADRKSVV